MYNYGKIILKNKKGITLIALVVTIIVLLILAGISVSMLSGNNGILKKATDTKQASELAGIKESIDMLKVDKEINKNTDNSGDDSAYFKLIPEKYRDIIAVEEETGEIIPLVQDGKYDEIYSELGINQNNTNYIIIKNEQELREKLNENKDGNFILANDIELTSNWNVIRTFGGSFNGNGNTIKNMTILQDTYIRAEDGEEQEVAIGFIGYLEKSGRIYNLNIDNANVTAYDYSGIIVGLSYGKIENCNVSNSKLTAPGTVNGGFVGGNAIEDLKDTTPTSIIKNCSANNIEVESSGVDVGGFAGLNNGIIVNSYSIGKTKGGKSTGGFVGQNYGKKGVIINCYSQVNINAISDWGGGFAGSNHSYGIIQKCYSQGDVVGTNNVGGFVGLNTVGSTVENCYTISSVDAKGVRVGGFVGRNLEDEYNKTSSNIINSYCNNTVQSTGTTYVNGFCGLNSNISEINNCYWNNITCSISTAVGGNTSNKVTIRALNDLEMADANNFAGFDFESIWKANSNGPIILFND